VTASAAPSPAPICTVYCLRPHPTNLADEALFAVVRRHLRAAFGPWVNLVSRPLGGGALGRAGLTSRMVYDLNHCGHGVLICGSADARSDEVLDFDPAALAALDLPLLGLNWSGRGGLDADGAPALRVLGLREDHLRRLAERTNWLVCRDDRTRAFLAAGGAAHAVTGGCPTLALEPEPFAWEGPETGAVITVRDPVRMGIPATARADFVGTLRALVSGLRRAGYPSVHLVCVDEGDLPFAQSLARTDFFFADRLETFWETVRRSALHVTFREDVALMCTALDLPFVHLACGEEARRPLETAGLGSWSLDLDDLGGLASRVLERATRFDELSMLRLAALPRRAELERMTARMVRRFAAAMLDRRAEDAHRPAAPEGTGLTEDETRVEIQRTPE